MSFSFLPLHCACCGVPLVDFDFACTPDRPYVYLCLLCSETRSKLEIDTAVERVRAEYELAGFGEFEEG